MRTIRIGSGAGYSGDRIEPAVELAEKGDIQYLVFECLGERTVALAQQARMKNPDAGFDPLLEQRMRAVLPICAAKGIKIVTNMGAAHPVAAARKTAEIAKSLGLSSLKIAAVVGDDVLEACRDGDLKIMDVLSHKYIGAPFPRRKWPSRVAYYIEADVARYYLSPLKHTPPEKTS